MLPLLLGAPTSPAGPMPGAPAAAAAPSGERTESSAPEKAPAYRNGVVVGLALGGGIGRGAGYPNNSQEIGNPAYHSSSGWMPGTGGSLLIMGALADYFDFGFLFSQDAFRNGTQRAVQNGLGLRLEAFPFVRLVPQFSGFGVVSQFGLGIGRLTTPGSPQAGGTQSYIGAGILYEWAFGHFLGGHFGAGPELEYDAMFSRPYDQDGLVVLARVVFYGGP